MLFPFFRTIVQVSIKLRISSVNGTNGAFLATRVSKGGCGAGGATGIFVWVMKSTNQIIVSADLSKLHVAFLSADDVYVQIMLLFFSFALPMCVLQSNIILN